MSQSNLENKVALVTGGSSGIGFATVRELIQRGAKVYFTGRNQDALDRASVELGERAIAIRADSSQLSDIDYTIETIRAAGDQLDILFYNAGIAKFAPLELTSEELFDETLSINFKGAYFTVQKALPILRSGASIIFNGSAGIYGGMAGASVYLASKGALETVAKTLAIELLERNIRVNIVHPGMTETPIFGKTGLSQEQIDEFADSVKSQIPLGRMAQPSEIAKAVAFLASPESSYIVGISLPVDGGLSQL